MMMMMMMMMMATAPEGLAGGNQLTLATLGAISDDIAGAFLAFRTAWHSPYPPQPYRPLRQTLS